MFIIDEVATYRVFITVSEDGNYLLVQKSKPEKILIRTEYDDQGIGRHILIDEDEEAKLNDDLYLLNVETGEEKHVGIWPNTSPPMLIEKNLVNNQTSPARNRRTCHLFTK